MGGMDGAINLTVIVRERVYGAAESPAPGATVIVYRNNGVMRGAAHVTNAAGTVTINGVFVTDFVHVESVNKYSGSYNLGADGVLVVADDPATADATECRLTSKLNLPDHWNLTTSELKLFPVEGYFYKGRIRAVDDERNFPTNANLLNKLRASDHANDICLGYKNPDLAAGVLDHTARILLRFNPPLEYIPNQPLFQMSEFNAGESYRVHLGNNHSGLPNRVINEDLVTHEAALSAGRGSPHDIELAAGTTASAGDTFEWVEIRDNSAMNNVQDDNWPGLDIRQVYCEKNRMPLAITIVVDISGSMADNEAGQFWRANTETPNYRGTALPTQRLYIRALRSLKDHFLNGITRSFRLSLFTFDGTNGVVHKFETITTGDFRNRIQNLIDTESAIMNANAFRPFTPLRLALESGSNDLTGDGVTPHAATPNDLCRLLLVITDGEGSDFQGQEIEAAINELATREAGETWKGVVELISYYLHPNNERRNLHLFHSTDWTVAPHQVMTKAELDGLFDILKVKYLLAPD